ncbi:hypothetical protein QYE76_029016 [Lolium multiflorum]|uniref:CCHC-type domain-containing protein n=1 Tax=Lolium multiflorum TaxID=4521 RepID=A0AAD8VHV8_LOLMU|nr:hypothetical protein QYE76_029016 [Lolium multiflorum]
MIHMAVTPKDRAHIRSLKTAKEACDKLDKLFLGNESIQSSRFNEVNNMAISKKNVEDRVARTHNTCKLNFALKMKDYGASESNVDPIEWSPDDLKAEYHEHMALAVKSFWNGYKRRSAIQFCYNCGDTRHLVAECIYERRKRSSCYNCGDKRHLVAECIYERRDENDGMLVRKSGFRSLSKGLSKLSSNNDVIKISSTEKSRMNMLEDQDHLVDKLKAKKCYLEENHERSLEDVATFAKKKGDEERYYRPKYRVSTGKRYYRFYKRYYRLHLLTRGAPRTRGGKVKPSSRRYREDEEQDEIVPTRTTKRQRDAAAAAAGKRTVRGPQISMKDLKKAQFLQEIICQFYATVVFLEDEDGFRSLKWMTREHVMEATWEDFARGIGYELPEFDINFFKIHLQAKPMAKEKMAHLYIPGRMLCGSAYNLLPVYDIMNRIYRSTLNPKDTNHDEVHGFLVNLLVRTDEMRGRGKQLDIMDFIWHEMRDCAFLRKLPQYAPFIMRLICLKWDRDGRGDLLDQCHPITIHKEKSPLVKKHDPPRFGKGAPKDKTKKADSDDSDYVPNSVKTKGLFAKLTARLKKSFCFKRDLEDRMYQAHHDNKKIRQRQKAMMRHMQLPVSEGSEDNITPPGEWKSKLVWSSSEDSIPEPPHGKSHAQEEDDDDEGEDEEEEDVEDEGDEDEDDNDEDDDEE